MAKPRTEMIAETRAKLLAAGRHAFGAIGYADASMDDFTSAAGLTRGALYHHFGDKKGLLQAVIEEIDAEMTVRLYEVNAAAPTRWQGFVDECAAYIEMALEPEIQRIMFRDAPAVLGDISQWLHTPGCIATLSRSIEKLKEDGEIVDIDTEAAARLINGASSHMALWIANADKPEEVSQQALSGFRMMMEGLRKPK